MNNDTKAGSNGITSLCRHRHLRFYLLIKPRVDNKAYTSLNIYTAIE
jgi:hypothetical protein